MSRFTRPKIFLVLMMLLLAFSLTALSMLYQVEKTFAVELLEIGVYWDQYCTQPVESINWGELSPGSTSKVTIFIRNEDFPRSCYVSLQNQNWSPTRADQYVKLSWNYHGRAIRYLEVLPVILSLYVRNDATGIQNFSFDIIISGTSWLIGDINGDGLVDVFDAVEFADAYGSTPEDPNWNPWANMNDDYLIDLYDAIIFGQHYRDLPE